MAAAGTLPDDTEPDEAEGTVPLGESRASGPLPGLIFVVSLAALITFLVLGKTIFLAVSLAMVVVVVLSLFSPATRLGPRRLIASFEHAAHGGVSLVAAAASVGIVLGVVTMTGIGTALPATIIPLAENSLFLALLLIMVSSIVLGMGLPSAVCYLLLATLIGPALGKLGVVPLAGHLFIFYFGLMSMVTPPVALAAYTAASIAGSRIMATALAAFRFATIGFVLPFVFVYRPELLMLARDGDGAAPVVMVITSFVVTAAGVLPLAAALTGYLSRPLGWLWRMAMLIAAAGLFMPYGGAIPVGRLNLLGLGLFVLGWVAIRASKR